LFFKNAAANGGKKKRGAIFAAKPQIKKRK
jgi:hypothetical protein